MNRAFLAVGVAFLAISVAAVTTTNGVVWSTFLTLGVVFLVLAVALGRGGEHDHRDHSERSTGVEPGAPAKKND